MALTDLSILLGVLLAILTALGGAVAWIAARHSEQSRRFDRMEESYNNLHREHTLVLVQVERFRLALQIAVAALVRHNPKDAALIHIQALLSDQFIFPTVDQTRTPEDMEAALHDVGEGGK